MISKYYTKFLCFFIFVLSSVTIHSQYILIKSNPGACVKYTLQIQQLFGVESNSIPTFLVFPKYLQKDSLEIKSLIDNSEYGIHTIYSDGFNFVNNNGAPTVYLVDSKGEKVLYSVNLYDLNENHLNSMKAIYSRTFEFEYKSGENYKFLPNSTHSINYYLNSYSVVSGEKEYKYKIVDSIIDLGIHQLFPSSMHQELKEIYKEPSYKPKIEHYFSKNDSVYLSSIFYYPDGKYLRKKSVIILFYNNQFLKLDEIDVGLDSNFISDPMFFIVDKEGNYISTRTALDMPVQNETVLFLAKFKYNKKHLFKFEKMMNIDIPKPYKTNFDFNLSAPIIVSYPYLVQLFGNEIINLETEEKMTYQLPMDVDYGLLNPMSVMDNLDAFPTYHWTIATNDTIDLIYIANVIYGKWYLQVHDKKNGTLLKIIDMQYLFPSFNISAKQLYLSADARIIYFGGLDNKIRGVSLEILMCSPKIAIQIIE